MTPSVFVVSNPALNSIDGFLAIFKFRARLGYSRQYAVRSYARRFTRSLSPSGVLSSDHLL